MIQINPVHSFAYENTIIAIFHADKNQGLTKHQHNYSHATMCNSGSIVIRKENKEFIMTKDTKPVNLVADEWHEIEALEDGTVFVNVFAEGKY